MHVITRCDNCTRQYDTEGHEPGERFHCLCGKLLTVPERRSFDASVVRCSSCGGVREKQDVACGHCGADFTLIEQQLNTTCPACFARISDTAKYCHHCATPIAVTGKLGEPTQKACPKCAAKQNLSSRRIKDTDMAALECNLCGGIWLDREIFLEIEKRMIDLAGTGNDKDHSKLLENIPKQSRTIKISIGNALSAKNLCSVETMVLEVALSSINAINMDIGSTNRNSM